MKESNNDKIRFLFAKKEMENGMDAPQDGAQNKAEKLKKPMMFTLRCVVFFGCMYLIFKPSSATKLVKDICLIDAVPQASDTGLESDKQNAYEQEMLEQ